MKIRWLWLGAWLGISSIGRLGAAPIHESAPLDTRISQTAIIPAEVSSHGMFVSVLINGQGPFRMLIDTGCSFSMISPEVAAAIRTGGPAAENEEVPAVNGLGNAISVPQVLLDSVTLGGVVFEGVVAGVVPLELQSKIDRRPLDGLLGYSLFSDLYFALDYPNHRLVLSQNWPKNLPPVRAQLAITERSGVPFVHISVQGKPFEVMVDTGANDSFHLPPAAVTALTWKIAPRPGFMLAVAGGTSREHIARLSGALALGPLRQKQPVVGLSEGPATIGLGLLHSFCLVFHEDEEKLWLCSTQRRLPLAAPVRTVGLSLFADPAGWQVAGIIPHSPAEAAGIGEGDLVTAIEGRPAREWTPDQIQGWIDTHPALAIYLSAPSGERELSLRVWPLMP